MKFDIGSSGSYLLHSLHRSHQSQIEAEAARKKHMSEAWIPDTHQCLAKTAWQAFMIHALVRRISWRESPRPESLSQKGSKETRN